MAMIWFELVWVVYLVGWRGSDITSWDNFWQDTLGVSLLAILLWIAAGIEQKQSVGGEWLKQRERTQSESLSKGRVAVGAIFRRRHPLRRIVGMI